MRTPSTSCHFTLSPANNDRLATLCGSCDENLRQIEEHLAVEIHNRGNQFEITGLDPAITLAKEVLEALYAETEDQETLSPHNVNLVIQGIKNTMEESQTTPDKTATVTIHTPESLIKPRGKRQQDYVEKIRQYTINFGVGPAGTGKTFLAVASAVEALENETVQRLVLVRPAVEAGEKLGFLPGDLAQKIDPYLRPIYDALYETLGVEKVNRLIEKNVIEVAPLAYMRGRSLNDSFIILDESQNTTVGQMKMFLTRIGFGSVAVITGDNTQTDLPPGSTSGLDHALEILKSVQGISETHFTHKDVVRHPLVQEIINAYDQATVKENKPA